MAAPNEQAAVDGGRAQRPSKAEQRVYLDDELVDFLDRLQRAKGFSTGSQTLRYCICQEMARAKRRADYRRRKQRQQEAVQKPAGDRQ